jgi:hypothetical protein
MAAFEEKKRREKEANAQRTLVEHAAIDVSRQPASIRGNGLNG